MRPTGGPPVWSHCNQEIVCRFVAALFQSALSPQSVRSYLSATRHLQIMAGLPDPSFASFPRLDYVLKGLKRLLPGSSRLKRLPITPGHLRQLRAVWSKTPVPSFDHRMLWAAVCLGFFGFLRAGEFTCPSLHAFTSDMLSAQDISVDSLTHPSRMEVTLRRSKTDPFGAGVTLHLGATGCALCPLAAMLGYLAVRPSSPGPLFIFKDGSALSRPRLVQALREALRQVGVDDSHYSGHSFRIGAATTAAQAGVSDALIKTLGRWKSAAYATYIRTSRQSLLRISQTLAAHAATSHPCP